MSNITSFKCSDGYDCSNFDELGQNQSPTPVGKECPVGHYCQEGNKYACPAGTYRETIKATSIDYCLSCKPGYYCEEGTGVFDDTILCVPGHYCPSGTDLVNMTSNICSPGHFCPQGADREIPCPAGSYCPDSEMIELAVIIRTLPHAYFHCRFSSLMVIVVVVSKFRKETDF